MKFALILSVLINPIYSFAQVDLNATTNRTSEQSIKLNDMKTQLNLTGNKSAKLISSADINSKSNQFIVEDINLSRFGLSVQAYTNADKSLINLARIGATALDNLKTKRSYVFFSTGNFYFSDGSEMLQFTLFPGEIMCERSCIDIADADGGMDAAMSQYVTDIENFKLNETSFKQLTKRINLAAVTPMYFFSDGPYAGGAAVMPLVESVDGIDGVLKLTLKNPVTNKSALIFIDLKLKTVIKSIVDGQEMDFNSGKPFATPLKPK